jgi:fibronectin type 3 domain-containing protein
MRVPLRSVVVLLGVVGWGCQSSTTTGVLTTPPVPQNLAYQLDPSGDPNRPAGILLGWADVTSATLSAYRIYSRATTAGAFGLRGETSSNTFHDNGVPHLEYYVTAVDASGGESNASNTITVDERLRLPAPDTLNSISLNQAIHLQWTDNAALADTTFKWYRVYSASYNLDQGLCGADWVLEGTTVSNEFLATLLTNGVPRCFGVSAITNQGYESLWSPLHQDTPRPDARNVLVYADAANPALSGFRFWLDANNDGIAQPSELGIVAAGTRPDVDFSIRRGAGDTLWFVPQFAGDSMRLYSTAPVADLTAIDFAPAGGYSRNQFQAVPGYGYVFQRLENAKYHYAGVRVTHVSRDYVIFDFSIQTDPGNPELVVMHPGPAQTGSVVAGSLRGR